MPINRVLLYLLNPYATRLNRMYHNHNFDIQHLFQFQLKEGDQGLIMHSPAEIRFVHMDPLNLLTAHCKIFDMLQYSDLMITTVQYC